MCHLRWTLFERTSLQRVAFLVLWQMMGGRACRLMRATLPRPPVDDSSRVQDVDEPLF